MKFIPSAVHAILDYLGGVALIVLPFILLPEDAPQIAKILPVVAGAIMIIMAVFTNFELGLIRKIGLVNHLMLDNGLGVFLAVSPWLFGFYEITYVLHLLSGIILIVLGMFTNTLTTTAQYDTKPPGEITKNYLNKK